MAPLRFIPAICDMRSRVSLDLMDIKKSLMTCVSGARSVSCASDYDRRDSRNEMRRPRVAPKIWSPIQGARLATAPHREMSVRWALELDDVPRCEWCGRWSYARDSVDAVAA